MSCPYPSELLEKWDGVCNPIGDACNDCEEYECEHCFVPCDPDEELDIQTNRAMARWEEQAELEMDKVERRLNQEEEARLAEEEATFGESK